MFFRIRWIAGALIAVTALAFFLRLVQAGQVPPALSPSEAAIGWNAYSILKTGSDELHRFLPIDIILPSGALLPPLLVYLTVPAVWAFGLTDFAVRLPSALFGSLSVLALYFLVSQLLLFVGSQLDPAGAWPRRMSDSGIALLAALLLAISPQHILLSRIALGDNLALFFALWGIGLLLSARRHPRRYLYAGLPLACAFYAECRVGWLALGLAALVLLMDGPALRKSWRLLALGAAITVLALAPAVVSFGSFLFQVQTQADPVSGISHAAQQPFLTRLFAYFQPYFILGHGGEDPRYSIQDVGLLYLIDGLFFVIGLYSSLVKCRKLVLFSGVWIATAATLAAVLPEPASAVRFEAALPALLIISAAGIFWIASMLERWKKTIFMAGVILIYTYSLGFFANNYFFHYPIEFSNAWQYGEKQAILAAQTRQSDYDTIQVCDPTGDAYHLVLFSTRYAPAEFWATVRFVPEEPIFETVSSFGKYEFVSQYTPIHGRRVLYILPASQAPKDAHILQTFKSLDGKPAFLLVD